MSNKTRQHIYRDEEGRPLYRKTIQKFLDGDKKTWWEHFKKGKWQSGVGPEDADGKPQWLHNKRLYNLPGLYKARNRTDKDIWIVEGEKCVERLTELGLTATCHCQGSTGNWHAVYGTYMKGHNVYLIADNDKVGREHIQRMARGALDVAKEVRIVTLPDMPDKPKGYDVADWIDYHREHKAADSWLSKQLTQFAKESPAYTLRDSLHFKSYNLGEVLEFEDPEFLIEDILPAGCFAILYAPKKQGKSFIALSWAAAVQTGTPWLGIYKTKQGQVVYVVAEGGQGDWKLRVEALHKSYHRIATQEQLKNMEMKFDKPLLDTQDTDRLIQDLEKLENSPILVILDTKARTSAGNENSNEDANLYVQAVDRIRERFGCAVLVVHHTGWNESRLRGASGFEAAADVSIQVEKPEQGAGPAKIVCCNTRGFSPFEDIPIELVEKENSLQVVFGDWSDWESEKAKAMDSHIKQFTEILGKHPGLSTTEFQKLSGLKRNFHNVKKYMEDRGLIENRGTKNRSKWYLVEASAK